MIVTNNLPPEMVYRFEMAPSSGQRNILQYMVPWLRNVELMDTVPHPNIITQSDCEEKVPPEPTNPMLSGNGWGSLEGTIVVLHNLLYITTKVCLSVVVVQCARYRSNAINCV